MVSGVGKSSQKCSRSQADLFCCFLIFLFFWIESQDLDFFYIWKKNGLAGRGCLFSKIPKAQLSACVLSSYITDPILSDTLKTKAVMGSGRFMLAFFLKMSLFFEKLGL